jgi:hypothetical protein
MNPTDSPCKSDANEGCPGGLWFRPLRSPALYPEEGRPRGSSVTGHSDVQGRIALRPAFPPAKKGSEPWRLTVRGKVAPSCAAAPPYRSRAGTTTLGILQ